MKLVLNDWQAETLRCSGFFAEPVEAMDERLWRRVFGREPDSMQQRRTPKPVVIEEGLSDGQVLRSAVQSDRFDLHIAPVPTEEARGMLLLGPCETALAAFQGTVRDWLDSANCPAFTRIAYGAVLLLEVDDLETGNALLGELLSLRVDGALDLEYKINRRRASAVMPGLGINRLCNWSTIKAVLGYIEVPADVQQPPTMSTQRPEVMCRLSLDINTVPSNMRPLSDLGCLFDELVAMGSEIAEHGDIS